MARAVICANCLVDNQVRKKATVGAAIFGLLGTLILVAGVLSLHMVGGVVLIFVGIILCVFAAFFGNRKVCTSCGSSNLVLASSPRGQELIAKIAEQRRRS